LTVIPFSFTVSGTPANVVVAPHTPLLWVVREHLKLTGTKYGCGVDLVLEDTAADAPIALSA
jgi:aerobic-type carbon monoxide dehydrogenase small subunit (CoxS/CutS family)